MAIAKIQQKGNSDDTSGTSIAVTLDTQSVSVGNYIVVAAYAGTSPSCSDNLGNTYGSAKVSNGKLVIFAAPVTTGGSCTVTISWSTGSTYRRIAAAEFSGHSISLDVTANQGPVDGGTGTDAITSTAATTTADGALIVGGVINVDTSWSTFNPGTNFTQLSKLPASSTDFMMEYRIQTSQGSVAATWTVDNTDQYRAVMAAFKESGLVYNYTGTIYGPRFFSSQRTIEKLVAGAVSGTGWFLSSRAIERVATGGFAAVDTWASSKSGEKVLTGTVNAVLTWASPKIIDISLTGTLSSVRTWLSDRMIEKYVDGSITAVDTWTSVLTGIRVDQEYFQYYKDDGSESAATTLGALNQNRTGSPNEFVRLRFLVAVTGEAGSRQYKLEWRREGSDTWREVTQ